MSCDFVFVHVPKRSNYYKPTDDFMFINYIPMGVFALCDRLVRHGIASCIKHLGLETILDDSFSIVEWVRATRPRIVGMSLHWHYQSFDVIDVARKLKSACPEVKILLGGFTATRFAREILEEFPDVDAIIAGDAEASVVPFARSVLDGNADYHDVPNCIWRAGDTIVDNDISYTARAEDLDSLEYANLSLLDHHEEYRDYFRLPMFWSNYESVSENLRRRTVAEKIFPLAIGRGCRVNCTFCGGSARAHLRLFNRKEPVLRSPTAVVASMEKALGYGYTGFLACFDPDPTDDTYALRLMTELRRRNLQCGLGFESWGLPSRRFIDAFAETFVLERSYIAISAESGSEAIRRSNKGIFFSNQEMYATLEHMAEARVPGLVYLTMGLPGETREHLQETARFAKSLKRRFRSTLEDVFCLPIQLEPTSALFEEPSVHGVHAARASFLDFYRSHGQTNTGPFTHAAYCTESLSEDFDEFDAILQRERCRHFCPAAPKLPGNVELISLGRLACRAGHLRWKRRGHGAPATERKTFT
jgi:radical SAM superfamily enzyme YgiQ (UPF0313 family)